MNKMQSRIIKVKINFNSKHIQSKKILFQYTIFCPRTVWFTKLIWMQKTLVLKIFLVQENLTGLQKLSWAKQFVGEKKVLVRNFIGGKKFFLGPMKIWGMLFVLPKMHVKILYPSKKGQKYVQKLS